MTKQLVSTLATLTFLSSTLIIGCQYFHDSKGYEREIKKQNKIIQQYRQDKRRKTEQIRSSGLQVKVLNQVIDQLKQQKNKIQQQKQQLEKKLTSMNKVISSPQPHKQQTKQMFEVTGYTANQESTGKSPGDNGYGITASGQSVEDGITIACPSSMKFGTKVFIDTIGYRTCMDRGSAISGNHIDLYMSSLNSAIQFGRKTLAVEILN